MQTVSQAWKNVHKQTLLNESFVEVSLDIADPIASADASATDNGAVYISNTSETVSEVDTPDRPYGTLEQNKWLLDGQRKSIPEYDFLDSGYVGDVLSNEECVFTKLPTITINFTKAHKQAIPGVTITWGTAYNEYAEKFIVTAYKNDTVVARKDVFDNKSVTSVVSLDIADYNRIEIQVLSWCLPNCRARIDEIFLGLHKIYSKRDLMSFQHSQTVDPISTSLPKMEIKFSIDNSDDSYNPYNLNGLAKYLTERQEIKTRYGLKLNDNTIEYIKGGTFYLSEWYAKQNGITADFVARDLLEFMSATYQDSDWHESTRRSYYDLAESVLESAGLPLNKDGTKKWKIDESLQWMDTDAPIPEDTIANCLQLIANACQCVIYPDRDGILHIEPISDTVTDYEINKFNSYSKSEITLSKQIKRVVVKVYSYKSTNGVIESSTTDYIYDVGENGETIVVDNPLVTYDFRGRVLASHIASYLTNRMTLKSTGRADVRLDALDIVSNENDYGSKKVRMTNVKFDFNGAFRGIGEGRVIEDG